MNENTKIPLRTGILTLIGTVIGAGIFFRPSAVLTNVPDATMSIYVWIISGIITICGGLTVSEIGVRFQESGGIVAYLEKAFGKKVAFIAGYSQMLLYFTGNIAGIAIIFGTQLRELLNLDEKYIKPAAIVLIAFLFLLNYLSLQKSLVIQNITTFLKLIPIGIIIVLSFFYSPETVRSVPTTDVTVSVNGFGLALLATLFAFDGWINIGTLANQMKDPERNIPKVIVTGLGVVTVVYILINIAYLLVATPGELMVTETPASFVADRLLSGVGGKIVTIGILVSVFGAQNGYIMTGMQVPAAMSERSWLPHLKNDTKKGSSLWQFIMFLVSTIMILTGSIDTTTNLGIFTIWGFTILVFITLFVFRKQDGPQKRRFSVPLYPVVPLVAIFGGLFILIASAIATPFLLVQTVISVTLFYVLSLRYIS